VDRLEQVVVGVNRFEQEQERSIEILRLNEDLERQQVERLRQMRARRERAPWESSLKGVEDAARSGANLMPVIITAVESYATVGEISDTLRRVFGEYKEAVVI
jgi:methylmalonyl-CoA mutase N-terminal domain/subunit